MANLYVKAVPPADLNRNTEWFMYPGVWTTYILFLFFSWLLVLSVFSCTPGMAWTIVNLAHFVVPDSLTYNRYQHPMLFFNSLAVLILVIAKFPRMHKVRIFGINGE